MATGTATATLTWKAAVHSHCELESHHLVVCTGETRMTHRPEASAQAISIPRLRPCAKYTFELEARAAGTLAAKAPTVEATMPAKPVAGAEWLILSSDVTWLQPVSTAGSSGFVYKVTIRGYDGQFAAKKVMVTVEADRKGLQDKMRREFRALQQAQHTNIVHLVGVVDDDPTYLGLLMELAPLGSLRTLLNKNGASVLTSDAAQLSLLSDTATGMAFLHAQTPTPILHHDLKTDNVLVFPDAARMYVAKITDFGMATGSQGSTMRTTMAKAGAGTLAYTNWGVGYGRERYSFSESPAAFTSPLLLGRF